VTTPVFVDEPCDPATPGPRPAINGLSLYCVPGDATAPGGAAWATQRPSPPPPPSKSPGGTCNASDAGAHALSSLGRPLECLQDADGRYRWADVS
jgi:hypothetical protein